MPRRLRHVPPGDLPVEVTQRTLQGRLLLTPTPELCQIILGVLGRAQRLFEMTLHAFAFLANHFHLIASPRDAKHLADFVGYVSGNIAREVARLQDWPEKVWGRRYASVPISGEPEAQIERLRYILAQGLKEGLVSKAADWPGVTSLPALLDGSMRLQGTWYDRTTAYRAAKAGVALEPGDWIQREEVVLTPLPALAHLSPTELCEAIQAMVQGLEAEAAKNADAPSAMGADAVRARDPHESVRQKRRSPIPIAHAASLAVWIAMRDAYRAFVLAYRFACAQLDAGIRDVAFPLGCFPPPRAFIAHASG
jgi:hypothetical protein